MIKQILLCLLLISNLVAYAQDSQDLTIFERRRLFKASRDFEKQQLPEAISTYEEFFAEGKLSSKEKDELARMLLLTGDTEKACTVLYSSKSSSSDTLLLKALMYSERYFEADSLLLVHPQLVNMTIANDASLTSYLDALPNEKKYDVTNAEFNSKDIDFAPVVKDDLVYFSSARAGVDFVRGDNDITGAGYTDVYSVDLNDSIRDVPSKFNTPYNDGPIAFNESGGVVLLVRNNYTLTNYGNASDDYNRLVIVRSEKDTDGDWGKFEDLPIGSTSFSVSDPFVYKDELYFISDMPGGFGWTDIYKVKVDDKLNVVGEVENLGSSINTYGRETSPFVDSNGTLYFASNGYAGFGGLDIYSATKTGDVYEVSNMGHRFNTNFDDFSFYMKDDKYGYFASNREGGVGADDIYQYRVLAEYFVKLIDKDTEEPISDLAYVISSLPSGVDDEAVSDVNGEYTLVSSEDIESADFYVPISSEYLSYDSALQHEGSVFVIELARRYMGVYGYVYNKETQERYSNIPIKLYHNDTLLAELSTDDNGDYRKKLSKGNEYRLVANLAGFPPSEATISTVNVDGWIEHNFALSEMLELEGIFYGFDRSIITSESALVLDDLVRLLNEYPDIRIELGSHTDSRGSTSYNELLSKRRSKSVVNYLIKHGVDKDRLEAKAYGESKLKNNCGNGVKCSAKDHQENRRTEIKIIE